MELVRNVECKLKMYRNMVTCQAVFRLSWKKYTGTRVGSAKQISPNIGMAYLWGKGNVKYQSIWYS